MILITDFHLVLYFELLEIYIDIYNKKTIYLNKNAFHWRDEFQLQIAKISF